MLAKAASGKLMIKLIREKASIQPFMSQQWEVGTKNKKQHPESLKKLKNLPLYLQQSFEILPSYWVFS